MAMMAKRINLIMLLISVLLLALLLDRYYRLKTLPALEMWKAYREIYLSKMAFMASWR